jgi:ABC-type sugar transport system permease subunit
MHRHRSSFRVGVVLGWVVPLFVLGLFWVGLLSLGWIHVFSCVLVYIERPHCHKILLLGILQSSLDYPG